MSVVTQFYQDQIKNPTEHETISKHN